MKEDRRQESGDRSQKDEGIYQTAYFYRLYPSDSCLLSSFILHPSEVILFVGSSAIAMAPITAIAINAANPLA